MRWGLRSKRVVTPDGVLPRTVVVSDGRIEALEESAPPGLEVRDVGELVISPGLVDCHVHINEPGRTEWEGFETATRAAAAGGVTTLVDMPLNCLPVTTTRAALEAKLGACAGKLYVDVGFWGGVVPGNTAELAGLAAGGVLGCKAFLVHSGIDEFPNATEAHLRAAMPVLKAHGLPLLAHAELELGAPCPLPNPLQEGEGKESNPLQEGEGKESNPLPLGKPRAYATYLRSRPAAWEDEAIKLLVRLCRETGCAVHIVHLSSAASVPTLRAAKAEGLPITVETCPHYLCFDAEDIPEGATHFKCAPPIRERENREALWEALFEGVIDFVISDHSPCTPQLKLPERGDFMEAWGGIASLQLGLSAIWTEAHRRGASLRQLSRWMSEAPARFAGLSRSKGRIAVGCDADLLLWEPEAPLCVRAERLFFKHKVSPYVGRELLGVPRGTWLRGAQVFDGERFGGAPSGRALLHRQEAT